MALQATLYFGDNEIGKYNSQYRLVNFSMMSSRDYNNSITFGVPTCDEITATLIAPDMTDLNLYDWYITKAELSGKIHVEYTCVAGHDELQQKDIAFEDAQCLSIREQYDIADEARRQIIIRFMATKVVNSAITLNYRNVYGHE